MRLEAQYELAGRGDTTAALQKRLGEDNEQLARIHALWALQGLGQLDAGTLQVALAAKDSALRRNAIRSLGTDGASSALFSGLVAVSSSRTVVPATPAISPSAPSSRRGDRPA